MAKDKGDRKIERKLEQVIRPYRVTDGKGFRLKDVDPGDTGGIGSKERALEHLQGGVALLSGMQKKLYAQNRWSVLVLFQAMDAAGKDGAIAHVMSGINPQGCQVFSFKAPSAEELDHDFLWRAARALPERGRIGIFNRSYYEEVLVVRVHREILDGQRLAPRLVGKSIWDERFESINAFERHLARNGTAILKLFLHVSKREQRARFLERLEDPERNWKFSMADVTERGHWGAYMEAYEDAIRHTSTPDAPWYVIPADNKWFTRLAVAAAIHDRMKGLGLAFPTVEGPQARELEQAREALAGAGDGAAARNPSRRTKRR